MMNPILLPVFLYNCSFSESNTRPGIQVIPELSMCLEGIIRGVELYTVKRWAHRRNRFGECRKMRDIGISP